MEGSGTFSVMVKCGLLWEWRLCEKETRLMFGLKNCILNFYFSMNFGKVMEK